MRDQLPAYTPDDPEDDAFDRLIASRPDVLEWLAALALAEHAAGRTLPLPDDLADDTCADSINPIA